MFLIFNILIVFDIRCFIIYAYDNLIIIINYLMHNFIL